MQKGVRILLERELLFASLSFSQNMFLQMGVVFSAGDGLRSLPTSTVASSSHRFFQFSASSAALSR
jgi:hypothetical protein